MEKALFFLFIIVIIIIGVLIYQNSKKAVKELPPEEKISMPEKVLENKKVALIVAFRDFQGAEYLPIKEVLEKEGVEIVVASDSLGTAIGMGGNEVEVNILLEDLKPEEFDAIIFIGGSGVPSHLDNERSYRIAKETIEKGKILGAICFSPTILAKAGVLQGKRATVWSSSLNRSPIKTLEENGAIYEDKNVVVEGKIITGNGPGAAQEFGEKLVELLKK